MAAASAVQTRQSHCPPVQPQPRLPRPTTGVLREPRQGACVSIREVCLGVLDVRVCLCVHVCMDISDVFVCVSLCMCIHNCKCCILQVKPRSIPVPPSLADIPPPGPPRTRQLSPRRPHTPANRVTVQPLDQRPVVEVPPSSSPRRQHTHKVPTLHQTCSHAKIH